MLYHIFGDTMKKIFKGILVPVFVSMIFGYVFGKMVYRLYGDDVENRLKSSKIYLVQNGEYLTYDTMREENSGNNNVYYNDENGYNTVVGITKDKDNVDKIKSLYNDSVKVHEYYVSTDFVDSKQDDYDLQLSNTDDIYEVKEVVDNILNLYRDDDTIKLILIK